MSFGIGIAEPDVSHNDTHRRLICRTALIREGFQESTGPSATFSESRSGSRPGEAEWKAEREPAVAVCTPSSRCSIEREGMRATCPRVRIGGWWVKTPRVRRDSGFPCSVLHAEHAHIWKRHPEPGEGCSIHPSIPTFDQRLSSHLHGSTPIGKGQMGSALMGSLHFLFFDRNFLGTPVNLLLSPQKCQGVLFSSINLSKFIIFAAAPLVLTLFVRSQAQFMPSQRPKGVLQRAVKVAPQRDWLFRCICNQHRAADLLELLAS